MSAPKIGTCRCGARWRQRGNQTGHCSGCHRTFTSLAAFDAHQRMLDRAPWQECVDPACVVRRSGEAAFVAVETGPQDSQPHHWHLVPTEAQRATLAKLTAMRARR